MTQKGLGASHVRATEVVNPTAGCVRTLVRLSGVAKAFGATQALSAASFDLRAGEVHALLGENGSGKSTLVKILAGVQVRDAGSIELEGLAITGLRSPRDAQRHGIVSVFQEVLVADSRSVLENVWMGADDILRVRVPRGERRRRAGEVLDKLLNRPLNLDTPIEELSLSDRQACAVVRALLRRPRVLILDEATSALDFATRDRLFDIVRELCTTGSGVILITHRLDEISAIGDRITVLRSGVTVATLDRGAWSAPELMRHMTGADHRREGTPSLRTRAAREVEPIVSVKGLRLQIGARSVNVDIRPGELVGVAGLEGQGQDAFVNALRGAKRGSGEVVVYDSTRATIVRSVGHAARQGIAYVPRERRQALFSWMTIRENFGMPTLAQDTRFGWLRLRATSRRLDEYRGRLSIVLGKAEDRITTLSGGNQQKVVIARWMAAAPRVLILNDPTRGIDIGAKRDLYRLLTSLVDDGLAVVMLSTELDEHVELMDRVLVFRDYQLSADIARSGISRAALVSAFFGEPPSGPDN